MLIRSRLLGCAVVAGVLAAVVAPDTRTLAAPQAPAGQPASAQQPGGGREGLAAAPNRRAAAGRGPVEALASRGGVLVDGSGAPPPGPVGVRVQGNRSTAGRGAGTHGLPPRTAVMRLP